VKRIFIAIAALVISLGAWAFWLEPSSIRVSEYHVQIPKWPAACSGLRVAVLADLHVGSPFNEVDKLRMIVEITQQAMPDLILLPGDFVIHGVVGGNFEAPETAAKLLGNLHASMGVYAVLGNHDWWLDPTRVRSALEAESITVLEDRSARIIDGACAFSLVGVSDYWEGPHDVQKAIASVPKNETSLLFTHNPDLFPDVPDHVTLTVASHTHGGQVYIPGIGRPMVPSKYGERFAIGHIIESGRHLFVSSGIGTSILPVRFLVPPEITILVLENGAR